MVGVCGCWGGWDGGESRNDVWRSADGVRWELATGAAAFSGRSSHQVVSYHGSLWVVGGYDGGYRNDVWRSADGVSWVAVTVFGGVFSSPGYQQVVAFDPKDRYSYEVAPVVVEPVAVQTVFVENEIVPLTLMTLSATGGSGRLRFDVEDERGVLSVGMDGVLVVRRFVPGYVTVIVRVRDATPVNYAVVAVTLVFLGASGGVFAGGGGGGIGMRGVAMAEGRRGGDEGGGWDGDGAGDGVARKGNARACDTIAVSVADREADGIRRRRFVKPSS